jgi:hypothetical protein
MNQTHHGGAWALLVSAAILVGCDDDSVADVLECVGNCTCIQDTRTCACGGDTACEVVGESDITLVCEGNARCDLACEELCRVECPGTAGCVAEMGDDSEAVCNGTGDCDYTCNGDCTVDCPGTSRCIVRCAAGYECDVTSCGAGPTDCGEGISACRTACPE